MSFKVRRLCWTMKTEHNSIIYVYVWFGLVWFCFFVVVSFTSVHEWVRKEFERKVVSVLNLSSHEWCVYVSQKCQDVSLHDATWSVHRVITVKKFIVRRKGRMKEKKTTLSHAVTIRLLCIWKIYWSFLLTPTNKRTNERTKTIFRSF